MEMDHHHHHHQYGGIPSDLRQLISTKSSAAAATHQFAAITQTPPDLFPSQHGGGYELLMLGAGHHHHHHELMPRGGGGGGGVLHHEFRSDSASANVGGPVIGGGGASSLSMSGLDGETASFGGCDVGNGRWPRQETLTLLEIRSRLDHKFKEANQKGPLWDEVSRIMSEEHGYQRSGKKCREKFENLYKYYKKTKEGKAGRQDGKHYRFFRQLEALYGDQAGNSNTIPDTPYAINLGNNSLQFHNTSMNQANHSQDGYNPLPQAGYHKVCDSLSLSNSSEFDTSSSDGIMENNDSAERRRKRKSGRSWRVKIKEFIDAQMRKLIEKQETWLEKLTKTLEMKEQERMIREEEWRNQESVRIDREHKFWAKERAWIEARDAALMESLQNLSGRSQLKSASSPLEFMAGTDQNQNDNGSETRNNNVVVNNDSWTETEITRLMELRNSMESRFHGTAEEVLWDEISAKMASFGFDKSAMICKEKWDSISIYVSKNAENGKKRKDTSSCYNPNLYSLYNQGGGVYNGGNCEQGPEIVRLQVQANDGSSPSNSNIVNAAVNVNVNDSCFRFLMADGDHNNLWENYGLKLAKENQ